MTESKTEFVRLDIDYADLPNFAKYVLLVMAQIRLANDLSAQSVEETTDMATEISMLASALPECDEAERLTELGFDLVTKTQFFDRQTQQIQHILSSLMQMVESLKLGGELNNEQLGTLTDYYKNATTIAEEKAVIEAFINGDNLQEAIDQLKAKDADDDADDCVLF